MRLRLLVFAIATTSSFCFAQNLSCVNLDKPQISYLDVQEQLADVNDDDRVIICIYVKELDGTLIARPLRNVLMMELLSEANNFVLEDDVVAHQELQGRLSKEWMLSQYYNPTWIPVEGRIAAPRARETARFSGGVYFEATSRPVKCDVQPDLLDFTWTTTPEFTKRHLPPDPASWIARNGTPASLWRSSPQVSIS